MNLLFSNYLMDYGNATERALIIGRVDDTTYADRSKLPRIQAIEHHVEILRRIYESTWDPDKLSLDQRCTFAVCSTEDYAGFGHEEWVTEFLGECDKQAIDITKHGNFQQRLDIFRSTDSCHIEGLKYPFGSVSDWDAVDKAKNLQPRQWKKRSTPFWRFEGVHCHGPGKSQGLFTPSSCYETKNLMACSRCKVVAYCSKECQLNDWPKHKKMCRKLADHRKDKQKLAEILGKR